MTPFQIASLALLGLVAIARLGEVAFSAPRARHAEREAWWPAMVATHAGVLAGSLADVLLDGSPPPAWLIVLAGSILAAATGLRLWVLRTLRGNWNVRVVAPRSIVTAGPYAFIRHPNYLAVILEVAALPLVVGAYPVAVAGTLANAAVLAMRIPFEEERLARLPDYRATMLRRPRLIPRLRRRSPAG
jgi:methyltransferase